MEDVVVNLQVEDHICIYGKDKIPMCPPALCLDEECQYCLNEKRP